MSIHRKPIQKSKISCALCTHNAIILSLIPETFFNHVYSSNKNLPDCFTFPCYLNLRVLH